MPPKKASNTKGTAKKAASKLVKKPALKPKKKPVVKVVKKPVAKKTKAPPKPKAKPVASKSKASNTPKDKKTKTSVKSPAKKTTVTKPKISKPKAKATTKLSTVKTSKPLKVASKKPASKKLTAVKSKTKKESNSTKTMRVKSTMKPAQAASTQTVKAARNKTTLTARVVATQGANLSTMGIPHYIVQPGEEYMNEEQRQHLELILMSWRQSLMEGVDRTVSHMKDEAANFPDSIDRASQEEEFSLELRTRDRERKLIKKIEDAIERLRDDDFGYCEACGVEIGIPRLEARPTATLCIDCKTLAEIKEKQTVGD